MHVTRLELAEFRLYRALSLDLPPAGLRASGQNASGKSTLVEAIALLATMRSPRSGSDRELINWASGEEFGVAPYARAVGAVSTIQGDVTVEIGLQTEAGGEGQLKKSVKIDGRPVRAIDAVGELKIVLFSPEDVALVTGSPSGRRRYLDLFISQVDRRYMRSLARYLRIVEQRNSLLKQLQKAGRGNGGVANQLAFWNEELVVHGSYIIARRALLCREFATRVQHRFTEFSQGGELSLSYRSSLELSPAAGTELDHAQSVIQRDFTERLGEVQSDELRRGVSILGPHRDDIGITLNGVDIGTYGSRGQQRLAVVALKLAEADQMTIEAGETPVILLDDVLSELDHVHRERLLAAVSAESAQLILTSTDRELLEHPSLAELARVEVQPGEITFTDPT